METRAVFLCQALEHGEGFLQNVKSHPSSVGYTCTRLHTYHLWPEQLVAAFTWYFYSFH